MTRCEPRIFNVSLIIFLPYFKLQLVKCGKRRFVASITCFIIATEKASYLLSVSLNANSICGRRKKVFFENTFDVVKIIFCSSLMLYYYYRRRRRGQQISES